MVATTSARLTVSGDVASRRTVDMDRHAHRRPGRNRDDDPAIDGGRCPVSAVADGVGVAITSGNPRPGEDRLAVAQGRADVRGSRRALTAIDTGQPRRVRAVAKVAVLLARAPTA